MDSVVVDVRSEKPKELRYVNDYPNLHRWTLFLSIALATCLLGPPSMNWPPLREMLAEAGAFDSACPNSQGIVGVECSEKAAKLENLGGNCSSIYYVAILFCGLLLDTAGAKICSLVGLTGTILGWILVGVSGPKFDAFRPGMFLVSIAIDSSFMGLVSVVNLFPGYSSTILGIFGASRSISFAVPIAMRAIFTATDSLLIACFTLAGLLFIVACWVAYFIPWKPFPKLSDQLDGQSTEDIEYISLQTFMKSSPDLKWENVKKELKEQFWNVLPYLKRPTYWLFVVIMSITLIRNAYYIETYKKHLQEAEDFYVLMNPLSFIPCPLLGLMFDKVSACLTCGFLALCGALSLVVSLREVGSPYASVIFNWVFISFIASQCYCYIAKMYPTNVLGRLIGLCLLVGGLLSFSSSPMNKYVGESPQNLLKVDLIVIGLGCLSMFVSLILYITLERPRQFKSILGA